MWDREFQNILGVEAMEIKVGFLYVDDLRLWLHAINNGWRWEEEKMQVSFAWEEEDRESGVTNYQLCIFLAGWKEMKLCIHSIKSQWQEKLS